MRRLNVREAQIETCIQKSMFALSERPRNPELKPGELLLLQLVKSDALRLGKLSERINFALVFGYFIEDTDGSISRHYWPSENREWKWILYGAATVPTIPFSLEDLGLSQSYQSQNNARYIDPADEALIMPFVQWSLAERPVPELQTIPSSRIAQEFGQDRALTAIFNHDRIVLANPKPVQKIVVEQFDRNRFLADSLKSYYESRCQVCGHSFEPVYGAAYSESHHIQYLSDGGPDISENIVVLCPNHHRIVHATNARFERGILRYEFPNGLIEPLILPGHLSKANRSNYWQRDFGLGNEMVAEPPSEYRTD
jgi:hypothetical protein